MKIPKIIKIGGHNYDVIFPYVFTERYDRSAEIDYVKKLIRIAKDVFDEPRAESDTIVAFIHEILHGIDNQTGHNIFSGEEGENRIVALSEGIYQVLTDNGFLEKEGD